MSMTDWLRGRPAASATPVPQPQQRAAELPPAAPPAVLPPAAVPPSAAPSLSDTIRETTPAAAGSQPASNPRRLPYVPRRERERRPAYIYSGDRLRAESGPNGQVLPPPSLRPAAWQHDDAAYLASGAEAARTVRELAAGWGTPIEPGARILDWGCGACRVLRHFHAEAEAGECWGLDMRETLTAWNQRYLSPPFRFATVSEYPHLGFEDNYFDLVMGLGVFSRLEHLLDLWLLELRRIMKPGGIGVFTVLSEAALTYFDEFGYPDWLTQPDFVRPVAHDADAAVIKEGGPYVFYRRAYIEKHCRSFFRKVHFNPLIIDEYYSALIVQK